MKFIFENKFKIRIAIITEIRESFSFWNQTKRGSRKLKKLKDDLDFDSANGYSAEYSAEREKMIDKIRRREERKPTGDSTPFNIDDPRQDLDSTNTTEYVDLSDNKIVGGQQVNNHTWAGSYKLI